MAKRNDVSVKVDAEVVILAKMVAAGRDQSLAEYLSETLAPIVRQHLDEEYARRQTSKPPAPKKPR
jgi:hypothetical protein